MARKNSRTRADNDDDDDDGDSERKAFDPKAVAYIIEQIREKEAEIKDLQGDIKELKNSSLDAGLTKKELQEALRLLNLGDDERNVLISQAGRAMEAVGRQPINPNVST